MKQARLWAGVLSFAVSLAAPAAEPPKLVLKALVRFPEVAPGQEFVVEEFSDRPLHIRYEPELDPKTFRASLNGKDVTPLFNPKSAQRRNLIRLPLTPGLNTLRIEADSLAAAANPKSALLPQEHILNIRLGSPRTAANVQTFATMERVKPQAGAPLRPR